MLRVDILYTFQSFELLARSREESTVLEQVRQPTSSRGGMRLEGAVICQEFRDKRNSVARQVPRYG